MPVQFAITTAELVAQTVEAVQVQGKASIEYIEAFCDLSRNQVENALLLAEQLGLVKKAVTDYESASPLSRFFSTPNDSHKAALIRVVLESYVPFLTFRQRLRATNSADTAAQQTKALLGLQAHRAEIKDTLISLGTFAGALKSQGGGRYIPTDEMIDDQLSLLFAAAQDKAAAEAAIRRHIGTKCDSLDRQEVVLPLANALLKSNSGDPIGSVVDAARAIESFLAKLAARMSVNLSGANGIIQKLDKFRINNKLPKKLVEAAKYLGQIRNAADHGIDVDPEVNALWKIQESTGMIYIKVSCAFISAALEHEDNGVFLL